MLRSTLLATTLLTTPAAAQQVYLDQQPSQVIALYCTEGIESNADNFTVGAAGAAIDTVRWWGGWADGTQHPDTFNITFHSDNGNEPGATLASFLNVAPTVTATGLAAPPLGAGSEFELVVNLSTAVSLTQGDYWVQIYSTRAASTADAFTWEFAPQDPVNGLACLAWSTGTPGVTWNVCTPFPETDLALQLTGGSAAIYSSYCGPAVLNSTGAPGEISATGSALVAMNDVTLNASNLPASAFGFFLTSLTRGVVNQPGGSQGVLCLGGNIGRYVGPGQIQNSGTTGTMTLVLDLTQHPTPNGLVAVIAGETWNFQAWYRDSLGGMATSNFTDGAEIAFQ